MLELNPEEWTPLRAGDIWRNGDIFIDPANDTQYVIGSHDRWGGITGELNTAPREGQMISETFAKLHPHRRRAIPMGEE